MRVFGILVGRICGRLDYCLRSPFRSKKETQNFMVLPTFAWVKRIVDRPMSLSDLGNLWWPHTLKQPEIQRSLVLVVQSEKF